MNSNISKILKIVIALIAVVAGYFFVKIISTGDDVIVEANGTLGIVGPFVSFAIALFIAVGAIAVLFSVWSLIKKPEALKKSLLGVVVLGLVLAASYGLANDAAVTDITGQVLEGGAQGPESKWVSTGIWYSVILGAAAIISIVLGGVKSIIK